jgi:hypothetical protein
VRGSAIFPPSWACDEDSIPITQEWSDVH